MPSSNDDIKNAIINEIEENITGFSSIFKDSEEFLSNLNECDFLVTPEMIRRAKSHGIDSRYIDTFTPSKPSSMGGYDSAILEEQIEAFMSRLTILENEYGPGFVLSDDIDDMSPKERISSIKLPYSIFSPLLENSKEYKPALHFALKQLSIINSHTKSRKKVLKSKRGVKREKMSERLLRDLASASNTGKANTDDPTNEDVEVTSESWNLYRQYLAIAVVKCIVEGTPQTLLIAYSLLHTIANSKKNGKSLTIPIGNILAAVFDNSMDSSADSASLDLSNPFAQCFLNIKELASKSMLGSEISKDDNRSQGTIEENQMSESGSAAGSLLAEQGTETASQVDPDDDDLTEEELLAQALAMSLNPPYTETSGQKDTLEGGGGLQSKSSFPSISGDISDSSRLQEDFNNVYPITPERLPEYDLVSTLMPFSNKDYWKDCFSPEGLGAGAGLFSVTLEHAMIALLVLISASADNYLGLSSSPPSTTTSSCNFFKDVDNEHDDLSIKSKSVTYSFSTKFTANPLMFLLLESVLDSLKNNICEFSHTPSAFDEKSILFQYGPIWSCISLLKCLRASLKYTMDNRIPPASLGLVLVSEVSETSHTFVENLFQHAIDLIASSTNLINPSGKSIEKFISELESQSYFFSRDTLNKFVHGLNLAALDTLVSGFFIFNPNEEERLAVLGNLMSVFSWNDKLDTNKFKYSAKQNKLSQNDNFLFYANYLLQNICNEVASWDEAFINKYNSSLTFSGKFSDKIIRETNTSNILSREFDFGLLQDKKLLFALLKRLSFSEIMYYELNKNEKEWPNKFLFWGEFLLLRNLQKKIFLAYESHIERPRFDEKRCHSSIQISSDGMSATHTNAKAWVTVVTTVGYAPCTGVHEWTVQINKCEKGHIFVGIVTAESSIETYIGGDSHGWGLIGTKALWHSKSKVVSDYGTGFEEGSIIQICYDSDVGSISFSSGDKNWGIAFDNLPNVTMYPAISLHQRDDHVSIKYLKHAKEISSKINTSQDHLNTFLVYAQTLCQMCDNILKLVLDKENFESVLSITSHPFLATLLPSLFANIIFVQPQNIYLSKLCINICGNLIVLIKRLFFAHEIRESVLFSDFKNNPTIGPINGLWLVKKNGNQECTYNLQPLGSKTDNLNTQTNKMKYYKIYGKTTKLNSIDAMEGSVYGTRIKFHETKQKVKICVLEGRVSLDGSYASGKFKDLKTENTGTFEAYNLDVVNNPFNILYKSSLLGTMALSHMISHLVSGFDHGEPLLIKPSKSVLSTIPQSESESLSLLLEDDDSAHITRWINSELLSGGLDQDKSMNQVIDEVNKSIVYSEDLKFLENPNRKWWLSELFPGVITSSSADVSDKNISTQEKYQISNVASDLEFPMELDKVILSHIGVSPLCKLGGESISKARQLIILAIIKHTGTTLLCTSEVQYLASKKNTEDRPSTILIDIWRASYRVIEHCVRSRQNSSSSNSNSNKIDFTIISGILLKKAEFLLQVASNTSSLSIKRFFEISSNDMNSINKIFLDTSSSVHRDFSRLLSELVEFFQSPLKNIHELNLRMLQSLKNALYRSSAFKSLNLLTSKSDNDITGKLPDLPSPYLHVIAASKIQSSMVEKIDGVHSKVINSDDKSSTLKSAVSSAHYLNGLPACGDVLSAQIKNQFEILYEQLVQILSRSVWSVDRDLQFLILFAWNIRVRPVDHVFLNRIGIFKILQTVLDDARTNNSIEFVESIHGPYSEELFSNSNKRLIKIVLVLVHSLASQVALVKDTHNQLESTLTLHRVASGPDTLSNSLFSMLYNELFYGIRSLMLSVHDDITDVNIKENQSISDDLKGETYLLKILKLLYYVSESTVCQAALTTPKWIFLLISTIGYGSLLLQRRLFRLLRKLLSIVNPRHFNCYLSGLYNGHKDILESETALDDFELSSLFKAQISIDNDSNAGQPPDDYSTYSSRRVVSILLETSSLLLPGINLSHPEKLKFLKNIQSNQTLLSLVSESLSLLRLLNENTAWAQIISSIINESMKKMESVSNNFETIDPLFSGLCILGGHIDRLSIGGMITLRPLSLTNGTETFAMRVAAAAHTTGLLVGRNPNSKSVEIILMEKIRRTSNSNQSKSDYNSFTAINPVRSVKINESDILSSPEVLPSPANTSSSTFEMLLDAITNHCLPIYSKSVETSATTGDESDSSPTKPPVVNRADKEMKLGKDDFTYYCGRDLGKDIIPFSDGRCGPTNGPQCPDCLGYTTEDPPKGESEDSLEEQQQGPPIEDFHKFLLSTTIFRTLTVSMQNSNFNQLLLKNTDTFSSIFEFSSTPTSYGTLGNVETLEEYFVKVWDAYSDLSLSVLKPSSPSDAPVPSEPTNDPFLGFRRLIDQREMRRNESNRSESPFSNQPTSSAAVAAAAATASETRISTANLLEIFGITRTVDPSGAIQQMMEMGFPQEWCEVALRRCRYNVELAINLCFEHSSEMAQMIEEDRELVAAAQVARQDPTSTNRSRRSDWETDNSSGQETSRERLIGRVSHSRSNRSQRTAHLRQLVDMGFPQAWCNQALDATQNNVDAALSWILSHGHELSAAESSTEDENINSEESPLENHPNPFVSVSGSATISPDFICNGTEFGGFASVGCRGFGVTSGKWYYEVKLHTAGCIQIGWVDGGFLGNSDKGEGVGDCSHSWAFDGWRMYLWHETSIDWGTRWAPGDVVGCALDMDERKMYFYMNGFGEEVNMGLAFSAIESSGPMYPCASFNKNEKISFNLGFTAFKHTPPEGFQPFSSHVKILIENKSVDNKLLSDSYVDYTVQLGQSPSIIFEDNLEEYRGDVDFNWKRRYFSADDSKQGINKKPLYLPAANLPPSIPSSKWGIIKRLGKVSKDLCILYSRLAVLRLLSTLTQDNLTRIIEILSTENQKHLIDNLLHIVKLTSTYSSRTKVYLQTISILPTSIQNPTSMGSIFLFGGPPSLQPLTVSFRYLIQEFVKRNDTKFIEKIINSIDINISNSILRENTTDWIYEQGTCPFILREGPLTDTSCVNTPSLHYAYWLSTFLIDILTPTATSDSSKEIFLKLCKLWSNLLFAPNMHVKLSAVRLLSSLLQEILTYIEDPTTLDSFYQMIPSKRLKKFLSSRLEREAASNPIHSMFSQALCELIVTLDRMKSYSPPPVEETSSYFNSVNFDWESHLGYAQADYAWETWTGSIHQLDCIQIKNYAGSKPSPLSDRHEFPPELFPGKKVLREIKRKVERSSDVTENKDSGSTESATVEGETEHNGSNEEPPPLFVDSDDDEDDDDDDDAEEGKPHRDSISGEVTIVETITEETIEEIGTVIEISTWPGCKPGSSRVVKWDGGEVSEIRWGAEDQYDACHVEVDKDGKVVKRFPSPYPIESFSLTNGFGKEATYGIILRKIDLPRNETDPEDVDRRFFGYLELPDFCSIVQVSGVIYNDNRWRFEEEKLVKGPSHAGWCVRFGHANWRPGVAYELEKPLHPDPLEELDHRMSGNFQYSVTFNSKSFSILGDIDIQKRVLFKFDDKLHSAAVIISRDKSTVSFNGGHKGLAFGNIGFSTGVHYWEFKIEQADFGSIFIGVCEKSNSNSQRLNRWHGYGAVNRRISLRNGGNSSDSVSVYGENFNSGDTVGVMLDMNRGKLSFFVDGLKFGEHILEDMGYAFEELTSGNLKVRPRVFYPVVGMSKSQDRIAITSRWTSSIGIQSHQTVELITRATGLLCTWSIERPSLTPLAQDLWIYKNSWQDWHRWKSERYLRVRTRCKASTATVILDTHPQACTAASICLGLTKPLFSGDRISISSTSGRLLGNKEEALVLGAFNNKLWYRLDFQRGGENTTEGAAYVWCFAQHDFEELSILSRGSVYHFLPESQRNATLSRIPCFQGGFVRIIYESGAVMRNGLEIDTSDVIYSVECDAVVYALERRVNSSNIARYRVFYKGSFGWISERIRGGVEELMMKKIDKSTIPNEWEEILESVRNAENLNDHLKVLMDSVNMNSLSEAITEFTKLENLKVDEPIPLDEFITLSSTIDGNRAWDVESDMQLAELITKVSSKEGIHPQNLSYRTFKSAVEDLNSELSSPFYYISIDRIMARASILKVANHIFTLALPYMQLTLPEERLYYDCFGFSSDIEVLKTETLDSSITTCFKSKSNSDIAGNSSYDFTQTLWLPQCTARRVRSFRRLLFTNTKREFWNSILESTTTPTVLPEDEYEDPREIKVIKINRVKSTKTHLEAIPNISLRLKQSIFGQVHKELRNWLNSSFRRAYLMKGHGGQKRAFKVVFQGEGVNDYGGPYRELIEQIVEELQFDELSIGRKVSDHCLLPLLIPCPNRASSLGSNQDKFMLSPAPSSPLTQELMYFFGKIIGMAVRHNLNLGLDLSSLFWRPLVRLPVTRAHLETIDTLAGKNLKEIENVGLHYELLLKENKIPADFQPPEWTDLFFTTYLADGTRTNITPNGDEIALNLQNWREFIHLIEKVRLKESSLMYKIVRDGISCVLPVELLPLFTANEMETIITGNSNVDVNILKQCAEYEDINPDSELIKNFWEVLEEMTSEERTLFLRFVWARSRMPASAQDLSMSFKIQGKTYDNPDNYLPHAQTCFFSISLPSYSTKEIMRQKILYAIYNSPNMDADVRLHNAEGWADA